MKQIFAMWCCHQYHLFTMWLLPYSRSFCHFTLWPSSVGTRWNFEPTLYLVGIPEREREGGERERDREGESWGEGHRGSRSWMREGERSKKANEEMVAWKNEREWQNILSFSFCCICIFFPFWSQIFSIFFFLIAWRYIYFNFLISIKAAVRHFLFLS